MISTLEVYSGSAEAELKPCSILVVDDSPEVCALLKRWLREGRHNAVFADNGRSALIMARLARPEVVITDILMPGGDGLELIMALRKWLPSLGVVAMSGGGYFMAKSQCLATARGLGAVGLSKPFSKEELFKALSHAMAARPS